MILRQFFRYMILVTSVILSFDIIYVFFRANISID
jgi:hypothetical protein